VITGLQLNETTIAASLKTVGVTTQAKPAVACAFGLVVTETACDFQYTTGGLGSNFFVVLSPLLFPRDMFAHFR
jgi:hypothetical protein